MKKIKIFESENKVAKVKPTGKDNCGRLTYSGGDGKKYCDVDGEVHVCTKSGEPDYPVAVEIINESLTEEEVEILKQQLIDESQVLITSVHGLGLIFNSYHHNTRSFAKHKAFDAAIEDFEEMKDAIIESIIGYSGVRYDIVIGVEVSFDTIIQDKVPTYVYGIADMLEQYSKKYGFKGLENKSAELHNIGSKLSYQLSLNENKGNKKIVEGKKIVLKESDYSKEKREEMAKNGEALPDGSFPIVNKADIENAIKLVHMGKNPSEAKKHIEKRAKELGCEDLIPDTWSKISNEGKQHHDFEKGEKVKWKGGRNFLLKCDDGDTLDIEHISDNDGTIYINGHLVDADDLEKISESNINESRELIFNNQKSDWDAEEIGKFLTDKGVRESDIDYYSTDLFRIPNDNITQDICDELSNHGIIKVGGSLYEAYTSTPCNSFSHWVNRYSSKPVVVGDNTEYKVHLNQIDNAQKNLDDLIVKNPKIKEAFVDKREDIGYDTYIFNNERMKLMNESKLNEGMYSVVVHSDHSDEVKDALDKAKFTTYDSHSIGDHEVEFVLDYTDATKDLADRLSKDLTLIPSVYVSESKLNESKNPTNSIQVSIRDIQKARDIVEDKPYLKNKWVDAGADIFVFDETEQAQDILVEFQEKGIEILDSNIDESLNESVDADNLKKGGKYTFDNFGNGEYLTEYEGKMANDDNEELHNFKITGGSADNAKAATGNSVGLSDGQVKKWIKESKVNEDDNYQQFKKTWDDFKLDADQESKLMDAFEKSTTNKEAISKVKEIITDKSKQVEIIAYLENNPIHESLKEFASKRVNESVDNYSSILLNVNKSKDGYDIHNLKIEAPTIEKLVAICKTNDLLDSYLRSEVGTSDSVQTADSHLFSGADIIDHLPTDLKESSENLTLDQIRLLTDAVDELTITDKEKHEIVTQLLNSDNKNDIKEILYNSLKEAEAEKVWKGFCEDQSISESKKPVKIIESIASDKTKFIATNLSKRFGVPVELTSRGGLKFTISFDGDNKELVQKVKDFFGDKIEDDTTLESHYDSETNQTCYYFTIKDQNADSEETLKKLTEGKITSADDLEFLQKIKKILEAEGVKVVISTDGGPITIEGDGKSSKVEYIEFEYRY